MLIDTHCHLDLPPLVEQLDLLLGEARAVGISQWIVPAVHPDGWPRISALCAHNPDLRPAYGIHPLHAADVCTEHLQQLDTIASQGVAIGEIGLDRTYSNLEKQEALFREQLRIARRHGLPLLIHCRQAIGRTLTILREEHAEDTGGIMHAFSGSVESALEFIKLGFVISISGSITRNNALRVQRLARELPLHHLVLETDAPDQTPDRHQGEPNRPAWLLDTATTVSALKKIQLEELTGATSATARRVIPRL
jgi:TatD DNase family protein